MHQNGATNYVKNRLIHEKLLDQLTDFFKNLSLACSGSKHVIELEEDVLRLSV